MTPIDSTLCANHVAMFVLFTTAAAFALYLAYQLFLHPLARVPGPRLAAITNAWKAYHTYQLHLHHILTELHARYGPVVRVGPNAVHVQDPEAVSAIYKGGRAFPKTHFYSAFQTFNHNLFGTQDDELHALRRRQLAHGLSQKSIVTMEGILDVQLETLCHRLDHAASTGEAIDLKDYLSRYVLDVLGDVAFSCSFQAQNPGQGPFEKVPRAIHGHILMGCVIGELPCQSLSKMLLAFSPIHWMRALVKSRQLLKETCASCVRARLGGSNEKRNDLLQSLIKARDPDTGARLTEVDINTEAFAMLVAGSHTTSGTLSLFFAHVLRQPDVISKVISELDEQLGPPKSPRQTHAIDGLEDSLPYLMACIRENFRMAPVFSMMLWRRITVSDGFVVGGVVLPPGTDVAASNYVQHHDAAVWGPDHDTYDPERWLDWRTKGISSSLIPFSLGHRMCIGRNLAMTNILKTITTVLTRVEVMLEPGQLSQPVVLESCGIGEMEGRLLCRIKTR